MHTKGADLAVERSVEGQLHRGALLVSHPAVDASSQVLVVGQVASPGTPRPLAVQDELQSVKECCLPRSVETAEQDDRPVRRGREIDPLAAPVPAEVVQDDVSKEHIYPRNSTWTTVS